MKIAGPPSLPGTLWGSPEAFGLNRGLDLNQRPSGYEPDRPSPGYPILLVLWLLRCSRGPRCGPTLRYRILGESSSSLPRAGHRDSIAHNRFSMPVLVSIILEFMI